MYYTSPRILRILAAIVWIGGSVVLILKGGSLLVEADTHKPGHPWTWYAGTGGIFIGMIKGAFIFYQAGKRNLQRIAGLHQPRIWQFYRPQFFLFLLAMITFGTILSRLAHGNFVFLLSVATLDITIATALLTSSLVFFRKFSGSAG